VTAALAGAPISIGMEDPSAFTADVRLVWLLDHCDLYLSVLRRRRDWMPWHVTVKGAWPKQGPYLATGFHHGTGFWVFKTLRAIGSDSVFVSARWNRDDYAGVPLRYWYGRLRAREMQRIGSYPPAFRPGVKDQLGHALRNGVSVVGLVDVPTRLAPRDRLPVRLLDRDVSFPSGILDIARDAGAKIVPYWVELDLEKGMRTLVIGDALDPSHGDTLQNLADLLDRQIRARPAAWMLWSEWPAWSAGAVDRSATD